MKRKCLVPLAMLVTLSAGVVLNWHHSAQADAVKAKPAYDVVNAVGLGTHLFWQDTIYATAHEQLKSALFDLGIHHVRADCNGGPGLSPDDPRAQRVKDLWFSLGIKTTCVIDARVAAGKSVLDPAMISPMIDSIREAIGASPIEAFEGPNEYNLLYRLQGYANWWMDLRSFQTKMYFKLKNDPLLRSKVVLGPSLAPDKPEIYAQLGDLSAMTDVGNAHLYSNRSAFSSAMDLYLPRLRVQNPVDPIWITEYGWETAVNSTKWYVSEKVKSKYLVRTIAEMARRPAFQRAFIYQLVDYLSDPSQLNAQAWFGLIDNNLHEKHSFYAVRNMMHLLCDNKLAFVPKSLNYTLAGDLADVHSALLQKNSGAFYLMLWLEVQSYSHPIPGDLDNEPRPIRLTFNQPISRVRIYHPTDPSRSGVGGREPTATIVNPRALELKVPDHVQVLEVFPRGIATTPIRRQCDFRPS